MHKLYINFISVACSPHNAGVKRLNRIIKTVRVTNLLTHTRTNIHQTKLNTDAPCNKNLYLPVV